MFVHVKLLFVSISLPTQGWVQGGQCRSVAGVKAQYAYVHGALRRRISMADTGV